MRSGGMLLSPYTKWGLKGSSVSLRDLFTGGIELALKDCIDLIHTLLAHTLVWKTLIRLFSVAVYLDHDRT